LWTKGADPGFKNSGAVPLYAFCGSNKGEAAKQTNRFKGQYSCCPALNSLCLPLKAVQNSVRKGKAFAFRRRLSEKFRQKNCFKLMKGVLSDAGQSASPVIEPQKAQ
jgi:hypothetical protein